jgi:hypothetical protein
MPSSASSFISFRRTKKASEGKGGASLEPRPTANAVMQAGQGFFCEGPLKRITRPVGA